ncbi:hypothetical protein EAF04_008312 [Stromatinia cepivora]|nr:hypothetical protein EAF04_008312 [Stromatinia cepivora]
MSENIEEPSSSLSGQENEEQYTGSEEYRLLREELRGDRLLFNYQEYFHTVVPQLLNPTYHGPEGTQSELNTQEAASSYESDSTTTPSPTSSVANAEESLRENEEDYMLNEGAQNYPMTHEPSLNFSSRQFNFENRPPAHNPSSILTPENLQRNEGLHTQTSQPQSSFAMQINQQRRSELHARRESRRLNAVSTTSRPASNGPISRESIRPYQGVLAQTDEPRSPFMPHTSLWRSRGALTNRQARFNGVSSTPSQTSEFPQMTHPVIDGSQANFSLSPVDHTLPRRTISGVVGVEAPREVHWLFRNSPGRPEIRLSEAVGVDENAEINQVPSANNIRPLPSAQLAEATANAANESAGTNIIRPPTFPQAEEAALESVERIPLPNNEVEARLTVRGRDRNDMTLSELRNQHCNDIRLEWIKRLLISGNVNNSDACPICQEQYTAPLVALNNVKQRRTCQTCQLNYTTTPNTGDAHDACAMPDCLHVFGRCCIIKWLKDKHTCPMCRATVDLP